jgi:putative membrane protein
MGFGFVVARFGLFLRELAQAGHVTRGHGPGLARFSSLTGTGLIVLGITALVAAVVMHRRFVRALERGDLDFPSRWSLDVILSVALMAVGVVMAIYLSQAAEL